MIYYLTTETADPTIKTHLGEQKSCPWADLRVEYIQSMARQEI